MKVITLPKAITEIQICIKKPGSDIDVMFLVKEGMVFYYERTDILGTIALARSPLVLLQLQFTGTKTESISKLKEQDRPYILKFVNKEVKILQEDVDKLESVFDFLQEEFLPINYERLPEIDSKKITEQLLFNCPENWFWIDDRLIG